MPDTLIYFDRETKKQREKQGEKKKRREYKKKALIQGSIIHIVVVAVWNYVHCVYWICRHVNHSFGIYDNILSTR